MTKQTGIGMIAAILSLPLGAADRQERTTFSDAIVRADRQVASAKRDFIKVLQPFQDGKPGDVAMLERSFAGYNKAVTDATAEARRLTPPKSPDCQELHRAFLEFLDTQTTVRKELGNIVEKVKESNGKLDLLGKLTVMGSLKHCEEAEAAPRKRFEDAAAEFDRVDRSLK
jgi:hypothetical protein